MTDYYLEIKLLSPLTSAAGEGRVGLVDRDIAFDDLGLPILPGRRLKGLWREAYRDVVDAWQQCKETSISVDKIFGKAGQETNNSGACFYIGNAELTEASSLTEVSTLKKWLEYLQKEQKIHADDVVDHYATVRAQTAIDRHTGSAKKNTLRSTRTLKSDLVFWAPVRFTDPPNSELKNALALGATSLRHMGTARTRGPGRVQCRLIEKLGNDKIKDLTPDLNQSLLPSIAGADTVPSAQPTKTPSVSFSSPGAPTHVLRYRLTLKEPAVIPVADGDPNTVVSRQDIPGTHLWGTAAWQYLKEANHVGKAFRHAFLDGGLQFLTAYPEAYDREEHDEPYQRTIPIPHSTREFKETGALLVDFTEPLNDSDKKKPKRRIGSRHARIWERTLEPQTVKTEFYYHHARASNDRRIGRALGAEVPDGGSLFKYEAIQTDQSFQGAVLGSENDLNNLKHLLKNGDLIRLGRSRSAQYGDANFEWVDSAPQRLSELFEWNGFVKTSNGIATPPLLDNRLIITALSLLLAVNDNGHPDASFPIRELAHTLDLKTHDALELTASYTRTEMIGGYHTHLQLPRQQHPAIAAGSVFEFELKQELSKKGKEGLMKLEQDGIGLRKAEGYGRIAVNRQHDLQLTRRDKKQPDEVRLDVPPEPMPQKIQILLQDSAQTHCASIMQQYARDIAKQIPNEKIPNNALLGRLRVFLHQDPDSFVDNLKKLRGKRAEEKLTNYQIDTRGLDRFELPNLLTLYELFMTAKEKPNTLTQESIKENIEKLAEACDEDTRDTMIDTLLENRSWPLCKDFLDYLITVLRRKAQNKTTPIQQGTL